MSNVQVLVFCWSLPLLVKIDATTLEGNIPNHSQDITKSSGTVQEAPHPCPNTTATLTLIWVGAGGNFTRPLLVFPYSLNNSETVKSLTLAFCSNQQHFIRDVRATFGIPYSPQSLDIGQNSAGGISDFRISGQSLIKRIAITLEQVMILTSNLNE